jgi:putative transposase
LYGKYCRRMPEGSRKKARRDAFDYIEIFYNPKLRGYNNRLSPVDYEKQYFERIASI